jgi:hypothetical protein
MEMGFCNMERVVVKQSSAMQAIMHNSGGRWSERWGFTALLLASLLGHCDSVMKSSARPEAS